MGLSALLQSPENLSIDGRHTILTKFDKQAKILDFIEFLEVSG